MYINFQSKNKLREYYYNVYEECSNVEIFFSNIC
jgi:hypothetical protein